MRKIKLISNFMTSQPSDQTLVIHIVPNISSRKGSQTLISRLLTEGNMRNIFLEKSYAKYVGDTSPRLFPEKLKISTFLDQ